MGTIKLTLSKVESALMQGNGVISDAARLCGVTRKAIYDFIQKHPELEQTRVEAIEVLKDDAENVVFNAIREGDLKTVRWWLERKAKERGYTTRIETTGPDGSPIEFDEIRRTYVDETEVPSGGETD